MISINLVPNVVCNIVDVIEVTCSDKWLMWMFFSVDITSERRMLLVMRISTNLLFVRKVGVIHILEQNRLWSLPVQKSSRMFKLDIFKIVVKPPLHVTYLHDVFEFSSESGFHWPYTTPKQLSALQHTHLAWKDFRESYGLQY